MYVASSQSCEQFNMYHNYYDYAQSPSFPSSPYSAPIVVNLLKCRLTQEATTCQNSQRFEWQNLWLWKENFKSLSPSRLGFVTPLCHTIRGALQRRWQANICAHQSSRSQDVWCTSNERNILASSKDVSDTPPSSSLLLFPLPTHGVVDRCLQL